MVGDTVRPSFLAPAHTFSQQTQVSLTSETVSLIPRKFSFAVTGTPLNTRIEDLQGLLRFLKVEPVGSSRAHLFKLLAEVPTFVRVCEQLGARTLKAHVEHELVIPDQRRFVVPVEFGAVEKYWYDSRCVGVYRVVVRWKEADEAG